MARPLALIDGDILLYRCGFAAERKVHEMYEQTEEGLTLLPLTDKREMNKLVKDNPERVFTINTEHIVQPAGFAVQALRTMIDGIMRRTGCIEYKLYVSGPTAMCFRSQVATMKPYKGNRDKAARPEHYQALRDHMIHKMGAIEVLKIEADDALAIHGHETGNIMCTIDKDLLQVPGWHYNFNDVEPKPYKLNRPTAYYNLFSQILVGDTTDNIPGCPGIGEGKARDILEGLTSPADMLAAVQAVYDERWTEELQEEYKLTPAEALDETAGLVYLLRSGEDKWDRAKYENL